MLEKDETTPKHQVVEGTLPPMPHELGSISSPKNEKETPILTLGKSETQEKEVSHDKEEIPNLNDMIESILPANRLIIWGESSISSCFMVVGTPSGNNFRH